MCVRRFEWTLIFGLKLSLVQTIRAQRPQTVAAVSQVVLLVQRGRAAAAAAQGWQVPRQQLCDRWTMLVECDAALVWVEQGVGSFRPRSANAYFAGGGERLTDEDEVWDGGYIRVVYQNPEGEFPQEVFCINALVMTVLLSLSLILRVCATALNMLAAWRVDMAALLSMKVIVCARSSCEEHVCNPACEHDSSAEHECDLSSGHERSPEFTDNLELCMVREVEADFEAFERPTHEVILDSDRLSDGHLCAADTKQVATQARPL